jgi:type 2 lantibiotic biosynthesis protein LanM
MAALLGESCQELRARLPETPPWLRTIAAAWPPMPAPAHRPCRCGAVPSGELDVTTDAAFLRWLDPLVAWARNTLTERLRASAIESGVDFVPSPGHPLLTPEPAPLLAMIKRVLVLELNIARVHGELCGRGPADRFACFCRGLRQPATALALLAEYPVLARELVNHLRQWVDTRVEFVNRLRTDLVPLREAFAIPREVSLDQLDVTFDAGDRHRGGRTVAVVSFGDTAVVYKPRPLSGERHFSTFVHWLNARGLRHGLRAPAVLDRGDYGWAEFVAWEPCADAEELADFYWRMGAAVAVFYVLRAYDMHMDNVIASGRCPVFIDMEAIFHAPGTFEDRDDEHGPAVGPALRESVLASLVLPQPVVSVAGGEVRGVELSALTGGRDPEQAAESVSLGYVDEGTDRMRVVRRPTPIAPSRNLPRPSGLEIDTWLLRVQVEAGFEACYRLLTRCRDALLAEDGPVAAFAGDQVRSVLRNTAGYRALLADSWHPDLLRDALDRDHFLALLDVRGGIAGQPAVLASERRQLAGNDIPSFTLTTDGTVLSDATGEIASGLFPQDGMTRVRQRIRRLSKRDLEEQRWYLRAALATIPDVDRTPPAVPSAPTRADTALLLQAATVIAERLRASALRHDSEPGPEWVSLNQLGEKTWVIGRTGLGLASGVVGIAVFLAELDNVIGAPRYRQLVDDLVGALLDDDEPPDPEQLAGMSIGAYEDLGSLLYLVGRLRETRGDGFGLDSLRWLIPAIQQNLAVGPDQDVVGGAPGTALVLLRLQRIHATAPVAAALARVGRSLRTSTSPRAGFGRGLSGRAYALAALGEASGDQDLVDTAIALLDVERDLRVRGMGWCDGMAGIALARAAMFGMPRCSAARPVLEADLRLAITAVRDALAGERSASVDDSLCHGRTGMAEALRETVRLGGHEELAELATRTSAAIAHRVLTATMRTGVPTGVWTPGLLAGAAGVGYGLLRAVAPDTVPNILTIGPETIPDNHS